MPKSRRATSRRAVSRKASSRRSRKASSRRSRKATSRRATSRRAVSRKAASLRSRRATSRRSVSRRALSRRVRKNVKDLPTERLYVIEDSEELPLNRFYQNRKSKDPNVIYIPQYIPQEKEKTKTQRLVKSVKSTKSAKKNNKPITTAIEDKTTVKKSKSKRTVRSRTTRKVKSPSSPMRTKEEYLADFEKDCDVQYDPVSYDDFADMSVEELAQVVKIGDKNRPKKHCYSASTLYTVVENAIKDNLPVRNPTDPNHRITEDELKDIMKKMRKTNKKIKTPKANVVLPPGARLQRALYLDDPNYYTLYYIYRKQSGWNNEMTSKYLGIIPKSELLWQKLNELYNTGRMFSFSGPFVPDSFHPRIHLYKTLDYWRNGDVNRLTQHMINEIEPFL